jgi:hypothetical protein
MPFCGGFGPAVVARAEVFAGACAAGDLARAAAGGVRFGITSRF